MVQKSQTSFSLVLNWGLHIWASFDETGFSYLPSLNIFLQPLQMQVSNSSRLLCSDTTAFAQVTLWMLSELIKGPLKRKEI